MSTFMRCASADCKSARLVADGQGIDLFFLDIGGVGLGRLLEDVLPLPCFELLQDMAIPML